MQKTKKDLSFFVFHNSLTINLSKKQKNPEFFSFFKVMTKKTKKTEENQKKTNMSLRPNILWKVVFFGFFGFLEVFVKIILLKEKSFIKGRVFTTLHNFLKI